ncbi:phytoene synthase [Gracilaria domingensis]|nr:phytoene synthase [Gracilaria domingensis]
MFDAKAVPYVATQENLAYTLALLRNNDNENYLANLLQIRSVSRAHAAIRAFNIELANIRSSVSNEDLGLLRLQFFRSQFADILSNPNPNPASPVLDVLAEAISSFPHVNFDLLHTLIEAREADLSYPNFSSIPELQSFGERTQGPLIHLHALLLGGAPHVGNIAKVAGAAVGLSIILRGAPAHAASRLSYMPRNLVAQFGVPHSELISGEGDALHVFRTVARRARRCLKVAQVRSSSMPYPVKQAFWPLLMADIYLRRLQKAGDNPFDKRLEQGLRTTYPLSLQMRLLLARLRR